MKIGESLKSARMKAGMSQSELAEKLGISSVGISQWESGRRIPRDETLLRIAQALGISISDIFEFTPEETECILMYEKKLKKAQNFLETAIQEKNAKDIEQSNAFISIISENLEKYIISAKLKCQVDAINSTVEALNKQQRKDPKPMPSSKSENEVENVNHLLSAYTLLNKTGQKIAIERLKELAEIPAYKNKN